MNIKNYIKKTIKTILKCLLILALLSSVFWVFDIDIKRYLIVTLCYLGIGLTLWWYCTSRGITLEELAERFENW